MRPALIPLALAAALLASGCGQEQAPAALPATSPSPSADDTVTGDDARAALAASPAGTWGTGVEALGPRPATPPGVSDRLADDAFALATLWLGMAIDDDSVHRGRTTFWADFVDPDDAMGVREALTGGRAYTYVNAFVSSARVLEAARVKGAFTFETAREGGKPTLRLTWKGSAVYAVESIHGIGSLQPVYRQITWSWLENGGWPGHSTYAHFGNVDICVIAGTGLIKPTPGDVDLPEPYLAPEAFPRSTEAEEAKQKAQIDAC